eukprot:scaffold6436_cov158-Amphora_coffeaeformis.AAC.6
MAKAVCRVLSFVSLRIFAAKIQVVLAVAAVHDCGRRGLRDFNCRSTLLKLLPGILQMHQTSLLARVKLEFQLSGSTLTPNPEVGVRIVGYRADRRNDFGRSPIN